MKIFLLAILFSFSCTSEKATISTLRKLGFTEIQTTGYEMFECSEEDVYSTGFLARNPQGALVSGTVCCGLWAKGCTIRW